jgi:hypothetical protein
LTELFGGTFFLRFFCIGDSGSVRSSGDIGVDGDVGSDNGDGIIGGDGQFSVFSSPLFLPSPQLQYQKHQQQSQQQYQQQVYNIYICIICITHTHYVCVYVYIESSPTCVYIYPLPLLNGDRHTPYRLCCLSALLPALNKDPHRLCFPIPELLFPDS